MTSPKQLKYWRKNVKNIILELIGFYLQFLLHLKICMFSKIYFVSKKDKTNFPLVRKSRLG